MIFKNLPDTTTPLNATNLNQFNQYSTNEMIVGIWINGKPLYRKVVNTGGLPDASTKEVSSGLNALNVTIIKIQGFAQASQSNTTIPLPFATTTALNCITLVFRPDGNIRIQTGVDRTEFDISYVVLEYIKTTD